MQEDLLKELKDISILCVEDEDGIREMIVSTLKFYFKEVYEAIDGNEAYELYDYYNPKIILTDIQMKNGNGLDLVKKIRETDSETMIIMLTAHSNEEYLIAFDLSATEVYQRVLKDGNKSKTSRNPVFPEGWQNQFGLPFKEHRRSMQVNIFDGYAVYGIKDNTISAAAANPGDEPSNLPDTLIHYDMLGGSEI